MRTRTELQAFDSQVRAAFAELSGFAPNDEQWKQATRGLWCGGLGLRATACHADAAYIASRSATRASCLQVNPDYEWEATNPATPLGQALAFLNSQLHPCDRVSPDPTKRLRQQDLSQALERLDHEALYDALDAADRADLLSEMLPGASTFLEAVPCKTSGKAWEPAEFVVELKRRLLVPLFSEDSWCPVCDAVLDTKGRHAGTCAGAGDRTCRHHAARNEVGLFATTAGMHLELEKPGLLPPSPDTPGSNLRRPADVFLPSWSGGAPAALDLAITSPQRLDVLRQASLRKGAAAEAYEVYKRNYLDTSAVCTSQGLSFIPMVAEPSGGWGPSGFCTLKALARAAAARSPTGAEPSAILAERLQRLCGAIRRATARAVLRREAAVETSSARGARSAALALLDNTRE